MRITLMPIAVALALAMGACGESDEPAPSSGDNGARALQERVERLEREAEKREAEAARELAAAERKAKAAERRAKREARRRRAQARAEAADAKEVAAEQAGGGIVVPDVTGLDHQAAQDALQGEGLWLLDEKDCTGQGRMLLWDRNWVVVSTDPPAGARVGEDTAITLCSKKEGE